MLDFGILHEVFDAVSLATGRACGLKQKLLLSQRFSIRDVLNLH